MSDGRKADIRMQLWGDWWYFAGAISALYRAGDVVATPQTGMGSGTTIAIGKKAGGPQGTITLAGEGGYTQVSITFATPEAEAFWTGDDTLPGKGGIVAVLRNMAALARQHRLDAIGTTPDELIEYYYRSRAAGGKVTLKQLAEQAGISYSYITKAKMKYDRAGKWGSSERKSET